MIEAMVQSDFIPEERTHFDVVALLAGWSVEDTRAANRHNCEYAEKLFANLELLGDAMESETVDDVTFTVHRLSFGKVVVTSQGDGVYYNVRDRELLTAFIGETPDEAHVIGN